jgi:hypothetical protein
MVQDMKTNEQKDDPAYIEWYGAIYESDGKKETMAQKIGVHKCTADDMKVFYPPAKKSKDKIADLSEKKALLCLDSVDVNGKKVNKKLFGSTDSQPNRTLVITMQPCIPKQITQENEKFVDS